MYAKSLPKTQLLEIIALTPRMWADQRVLDFLDALRKKFRQKPVDLSKLYMNDLNIENNMDVDEPRLPQPGESSLVRVPLFHSLHFCQNLSPHYIFIQF